MEGYLCFQITNLVFDFHLFFIVLYLLSNSANACDSQAAQVFVCHYGFWLYQIATELI